MQQKKEIEKKVLQRSQSLVYQASIRVKKQSSDIVTPQLHSVEDQRESASQPHSAPADHESNAQHDQTKHENQCNNEPQRFESNGETSKQVEGNDQLIDPIANHDHSNNKPKLEDVIEENNGHIDKKEVSAKRRRRNREKKGHKLQVSSSASVIPLVSPSTSPSDQNGDEKEMNEEQKEGRVRKERVRREKRERKEEREKETEKVNNEDASSGGRDRSLSDLKKVKKHKSDSNISQKLIKHKTDSGEEKQNAIKVEQNNDEKPKTKLNNNEKISSKDAEIKSKSKVPTGRLRTSFSNNNFSILSPRDNNDLTIKDDLLEAPLSPSSNSKNPKPIIKEQFKDLKTINNRSQDDIRGKNNETIDKKLSKLTSSITHTSSITKSLLSTDSREKDIATTPRLVATSSSSSSLFKQQQKRKKLRSQMDNVPLRDRPQSSANQNGAVEDQVDQVLRELEESDQISFIYSSDNSLPQVRSGTMEKLVERLTLETLPQG